MKIIYTYHAIERRLTRRISKDMIAQSIRKPDHRKRETDGDTQFIKTVSRREVHVVAKPLDKRDEWLIKTVWVDDEGDPNLLVKLMVKIGVRLFYPFLR